MCEVSSEVSSIWEEYSKDENTFYQGLLLLDALDTDSADGCAKACKDKGEDCVYWAWCPTDAGNG